MYLRSLLLVMLSGLLFTSCYTQLAFVHHREVYREFDEYWIEEDSVYSEEADEVYVVHHIYDFPEVYSYRFSVYDPWYWDAYYDYWFWGYAGWPYYGYWHYPRVVIYDPYYYGDWWYWRGSGHSVWEDHSTTRYGRRNPYERTRDARRIAATGDTRKDDANSERVVRRLPGSRLVDDSGVIRDGRRTTSERDLLPAAPYGSSPRRDAATGVSSSDTRGRDKDKEVKATKRRTVRDGHYVPVRGKTIRRAPEKARSVRSRDDGKSATNVKSRSNEGRSVKSADNNRRSSSPGYRSSGNSSSSRKTYSPPARSSSSSRSSGASRSSSSRSSSRSSGSSGRERK